MPEVQGLAPSVSHPRLQEDQEADREEVKGETTQRRILDGEKDVSQTGQALTRGESHSGVCSSEH